LPYCYSTGEWIAMLTKKVSATAGREKESNSRLHLTNFHFDLELGATTLD
jgi:hypothetical protein